jgi:hypothetical protein
MLKAVGFNLRTQDKELLRKMIEKVLDIKEYEIIDLRVNQLTISNNDDFLISGDKAERLCKLENCNKKLIIQDVSLLEHGNNNDVSRQATYSALLKFKEELKLPRQILIKKEPIQVISKQELKTIEEKEYLVILNDGRKVKIVDMSDKKDGKYDIEITIQELKNLKLAIDTLQAKEITIVSH